MTVSKGFRKGTRQKFSRGYRHHFTGTQEFQRVYRAGDVVDVKVNGAVHKGMPHNFYHGRTGRVFAVMNNAVGVILTKPVGNRVLLKRMYIRTEHLRPSKSSEDFKLRVARNDAARRAGEKVQKRQAEQPKPAYVVSDVTVTDAAPKGTF